MATPPARRLPFIARERQLGRALVNICLTKKYCHCSLTICFYSPFLCSVAASKSELRVGLSHQLLAAGDEVKDRKGSRNRWDMHAWYPTLFFHLFYSNKYHTLCTLFSINNLAFPYFSFSECQPLRHHSDD